jgi:hypothetical protein
MTVQHLATPQCDMLQHSTTSRNISSTPSSEACAGTSCAPHAAPPASCAQIARAARCCHDGALQMGFSVPFTIFHTLITIFGTLQRRINTSCDARANASHVALAHVSELIKLRFRRRRRWHGGGCSCMS